jgi:hypothetical protein
LASSTGTGAVVLATSPTITTPTIDTITSAASTALTLKSAGTTAVTIDTSQNVGIGTASPTNKLHVSSSSFETIKLQGTSTVSGINFVNSASSNGYIYYDNGPNMLFYTNGSERARIDSSGNLLVGTTSTFSPGGVPTTNSVSNGTSVKWAQGIRNTASSTPYGLAIDYPNAAPNSTGSQFIYCPDSTGTKFEARSNGGIANFSANNVNLSDQREKKNIEFAGNYLNKICQIPVKTFLFNDQTDDELNLGAIAQEVQAVAPELVSESNWGTIDKPKMRLSIYQTDLQYALMKSIQELKTINDTQAETINALTARIEALEGK